MEINRGENIPFTVTLSYPDKTIFNNKVDEMIFWLKENDYDLQPKIQKLLSKGDITFDLGSSVYSFNLLPNETKNLIYERNYYVGIRIFINKNPITVFSGKLYLKNEMVYVYEIGDENE